MFRKENINPLGFSFKPYGLKLSYWSSILFNFLLENFSFLLSQLK